MERSTQSTASMVEDVVRGGEMHDAATSMVEAYVHLVDGSLQYSSRPVAHVHEMEVFGPEGQPSYFQVSGFHRAEVEAANTLAMMRQCGDPVLGFVVPRRRRSRMLRRQPRIPNSFQVLGRYIGIHHGLNNVTQKPNQERCNC
jgi:hypothetical protein